MMARSAPESNIRYDVTSMTLSTDEENIKISEFEAKFDENIPKLFKQITFYKANRDALKVNAKPIDPENLDIPSINQNQSQILDMIDYSNTQLGRSIEETSSILSFVENQNLSTDELSNTLLSSLNNWLENTQKQYEIMDKDVGRIMAEMEAFNFEGLFKTTEDLLDNLNKKLEDTSDDFKQFKSFSRLINKNLETLKTKKKQLINFPKMLKRAVQGAGSNSGSSNLNTVLALLLLTLGVVIILGLLAILYRLGVSRKRDILG